MGRRIVLVTSGVVLVVLALVTGSAALVAFGLFGSTETITLPAGRITSDPGATAIVLDVDRWDAALPVVAGDRHVAAVFRSVDGKPLFAGLGTRPDIDAYLLGTPTTIAVRAGDRWRTVDVPGDELPAPPELAPVWVRTGSGAEAQVWIDGMLPGTLAVMRPTPSAGLDVLVDVRTMIPGISRVIIGLSIVAIALLGLGVTLTVLGARRRVEAPSSRTVRSPSGGPPADSTSAAASQQADT